MARFLHVAACFLFLTKLSIGQRQVTVQEGPLYRAAGYSISISCKVTGYLVSTEQHFQWSVYLPQAPDQEVQIISTSDDSFTYAKYGQRVRSKDIYVERLQGDMVLLHISKLLMEDSGEYECHTPNTDGKYYGSYSAKTKLYVIPDTLSATMTPQTLRKAEGERLELTCKVSKATVQHTHLSVTWYRMQNGERNHATKIISLSRDFTVEPGTLYKQRFEAGDVGLDKLAMTTFRLSIERLQPSDQGQLFCEATEWIQDPDENWTWITQKQTQKTHLEIQPTERDLQVHIKAAGTFTEGKSLELVCLVEGSGLNPQLQGIWFFNSSEIARIDAGGVLSLSEDYKKRASQRQLQVSKFSPKNFSLSIFSVSPDDEGTYRCEVSEMERGQVGSWQVLQRKQSPDHHVHLRRQTAPTRSVMVSAESTQPAVWEGEPLALLCKVDGPESLLSVGWWHTPEASRTQAGFVASMGQDGTVRLGAHNRTNTRLEKKDWATFQLHITSTAATDGGTYECRVSEVTLGRTQSWAGMTSVTVNALASSFQVILSSRQPQVRLAHFFNLHCVVKAKFSDLQVPLTVTWQFQPTGSQVFHQLVRITHDGVIEWGDALPQFQKKTRVSQTPFHSQLLVHDATEEEAGMYRCRAEAYDRNHLRAGGEARASASSHSLRIDVTFPESDLEVDASSHTQEVPISSYTVIECGILSPPAGQHHLAIRWDFSPLSTNGTWLRLLYLDQASVVTYGPQFHSPGRKHKFHVQKVAPGLFQLHILSVDNSDQGRYRCAVGEWLQAADGSWRELGEKTSGPTELKLKSTGRELRVSGERWTESVTEHGEAALRCSLDRSGGPASLFSVAWFRGGRGLSGAERLAQLQRDGQLELGAQSHLLCFRNSSTDFVLKLPRAQLGDAGPYWCEVTEWRLLGTPGQWVNWASATSRRMALTVLPAESTLLSRICSSAPLLYFLLTLLFIVLLLLLVSFLCLYQKAKRLSALSCNAQKEQALWVDMKRMDGKPTIRMEEEDEDED